MPVENRSRTSACETKVDVMTDSYRPVLRTQADLETAWRHLVRPLGFRTRSLWLLMIDDDHRPIPAVTEISDLPAEPDDASLHGLGELLVHLPPPGDAGRWALLLSRPGRHRTDDHDRQWVAGLYATMRDHTIPFDVIHLATDLEILPVPLDDVSGYLQAS